MQQSSDMVYNRLLTMSHLNLRQFALSERGQKKG
jgi:hypothetical protein